MDIDNNPKIRKIRQQASETARKSRRAAAYEALSAAVAAWGSDGPAPVAADARRAHDRAAGRLELLLNLAGDLEPEILHREADRLCTAFEGGARTDDPLVEALIRGARDLQLGDEALGVLRQILDIAPGEAAVRAAVREGVRRLAVARVAVLSLSLSRASRDEREDLADEIRQVRAFQALIEGVPS